MHQSKKILIIDDDADIVESMSLVLQSRNFSVIKAYSAGEGWEKTAAEMPDLILLDVMMPIGTEGFHFVWKIRASEDERISQIPIAIITSIRESTDLKLFPAGDREYKPGQYLPVQKFIDKPIHPTNLIDTVKELLGD
jgi:CheY-like chemotaxis protein